MRHRKATSLGCCFFLVPNVVGSLYPGKGLLLVSHSTRVVAVAMSSIVQRLRNQMWLEVHFQELL